jgi:hypothetical protein
MPTPYIVFMTTSSLSAGGKKENVVALAEKIAKFLAKAFQFSAFSLP